MWQRVEGYIDVENLIRWQEVLLGLQFTASKQFYYPNNPTSKKEISGIIHADHSYWWGNM